MKLGVASLRDCGGRVVVVVEVVATTVVVVVLGRVVVVLVVVVLVVVVVGVPPLTAIHPSLVWRNTPQLVVVTS